MCLKKALRAWAFAIAFSLVNKKKRKYEAFPESPFFDQFKLYETIESSHQKGKTFTMSF